MPGILFRHIFFELAKVLLVTTTVLVTVIAFGAAIKPLSENLLGPGDLLKYILFATIPMLQYALPFAAAFAGTIVYHRLTTDNEIVAMAASGMPYRTVLRPAVGMGLLLTVVMLILVDSGVPTFWQALKRIAWNDGTRILAAQTERGQAWVPASGARLEILPDSAYTVDPATISGDVKPSLRLVLDRVVALRLDEDGMPKTEFTAQAATVDQYKETDQVYLKVALVNATVFTRGENQFARVAVVRPDAIALPSFEQGPKGLTIRELLAARHDLSVFPLVAAARERVERTLRTVEWWRHIGSSVAQQGRVTFGGTGDALGTTYDVLTGELRGRDLLPATEQASDPRRRKGVTIHQYDQVNGTNVLRRAIVAPKFRVTFSEFEGELRCDLSAERATVYEPADAERGLERPIRFSELLPQGLALSSEPAVTDAALRERAEAVRRDVMYGPREDLDQAIADSLDQLADQVQHFSDEIVARLVQRASQAMTVLLMLLNASILAILLRHRSPLFVYVVAFVPAILNILMISGGEQMLRREIGVTGFVVAFGGNAVLAICLTVAAAIVRRH